MELTLFDNLDIKKTASNVKDYLKGFQRMRIKSGQTLQLLGSPNMDGMPKAPSFENTADKRIVERASAAMEARTILKTISLLDSTSQTILNNLYIYPDPKSNDEIMSLLNISSTQYDVKKKIALVAFADGYYQTNLCVYSKPDKNGQN